MEAQGADVESLGREKNNSEMAERGQLVLPVG